MLWEEIITMLVCIMRYSSRVADADAVAYISRKEAKIRQADTRD